MRGAVTQWPLVQAADKGAAPLMDYLRKFDNGAEVAAFVGPPEIEGRYFYRPGLDGFNFDRRSGPLSGVLDFLLRIADESNPPSVYVGATPIDTCLPRLREHIPFPLAANEATPRIWIGNASRVNTHFDVSDNIACVIAGERRFTLFPPDQVANLYVGPLDYNMAGQPTSMVDLHAPDFDRYPRFRQALESARYAELRPGDAIYVPALWWHHVDALSKINVLLNYWWRLPDNMGSPFDALVHGIWAIGGLPENERHRWESMFEHYVFRKNGDPTSHLPKGREGILGGPSPKISQRLHAFLVRALGR